MLQLIFQDYWPYAVGVLIVIFVVYGIRSGIKESTEERNHLSSLMDQLFGTVTDDEVARNTRTPHSRIVGDVKIDGATTILLVLEGRDGIFVAKPKEGRSYSIPWSRIDKIDQKSEERIAVYVNRDDRPPIEISLPWSRDMSLDNWQRFSQANRLSPDLSSSV